LDLFESPLGLEGESFKEFKVSKVQGRTASPLPLSKGDG